MKLLSIATALLAAPLVLGAPANQSGYGLAPPAPKPAYGQPAPKPAYGQAAPRPYGQPAPKPAFAYGQAAPPQPTSSVVPVSTSSAVPVIASTSSVPAPPAPTSTAAPITTAATTSSAAPTSTGTVFPTNPVDPSGGLIAAATDCPADRIFAADLFDQSSFTGAVQSISGRSGECIPFNFSAIATMDSAQFHNGQAEAALKAALSEAEALSLSVIFYEDDQCNGPVSKVVTGNSVTLGNSSFSAASLKFFCAANATEPIPEDAENGTTALTASTGVSAALALLLAFLF